MKKSATALIVLLSMASIPSVHAEEYPPQQHAEESCPVVPPVTVYVYRTLIEYKNNMIPVPGPTVYVSKPAPTIYVTQPPIIINKPAPTVAPVETPKAHEVVTHTVYRAQFVPTDKIETIVALAKFQYQAKTYKQAYLNMRKKYLALAKTKKKEK